MWEIMQGIQSWRVGNLVRGCLSFVAEDAQNLDFELKILKNKLLNFPMSRNLVKKFK